MFKKLLTYICMLFVAGVGFFGVSHNQTNSSFHLITSNEVFAGMCDDDPAQCGSQNTQANAGEQDKAMREMYNKLVGGLNIFLAIVTIIVSPAIMFAGWLMSPDWTSGDLFGIRPVLHNLWILVANVTYFIYAILLIFIALATIFNSDKYGYKQLLPKLALGILLVPLTWWFIQFIISLSSIVTASVLNMPAEALQKYMSTQKSTQGEISWWDKKMIPKTIEYNNEYNKIKKNIESVKCTDKTCLSPSQMLGDSAGMYSALLIYGYGVFKFSEVKEINTWTDGVKSVFSLINQGIIGVVMFLVFGLLVMALIFMLLMRAIKLWFYAIFSPLMTLKYVIGDGFFGGKENSDSFELKEFIGLAFVPALVGMALSFGLIVISLLQTSTNVGDGSCNDAKLMSEGCKIIGIMGNSKNEIRRKLELTQGADQGPGSEQYNSVNEIKIGGMTYRYVGSIVKGYEVGNATSQVNGAQSALSSVGGIFGTIIIDIIALVFIWVAFMAAKNVSKAVKAAVSPFEELGGKIGKLGMSLPKYAPILPGGLSISGANKLAEKGSYMIDQAHDKKIAESQLGKIMGYGDAVGAADKKRMDEYTKAGLKNADAMKGAVQLMQQNATKTNFDTDPMAKGFMDTLKKEFGSQIEIESQLKHAGVDERNAKIIAEAAIKEKTDLRLNKDLLGAWKDIAKSGINSSATKDSSTIIQASQFNKDTKSMAVDISGIAFTIKDGKVSEADIKRLEEGIRTIPSNEKDFVKVLTNKLIFSGLDSSQADLVGKQLADKLKNKFGDVKKEEPKKS